MTINVQKIQQLHDHLVKLVEIGRTDKFNMCEWLYDLEAHETIDHLEDSSNPECGTAGCLAGHVVIMDQAMTEGISDYAQETLGLEDREAQYMFLGNWSRAGLTGITIEETIDYLKRVVERGTVFVSVMEEDEQHEEENNAWLVENQD